MAALVISFNFSIADGSVKPVMPIKASLAYLKDYPVKVEKIYFLTFFYF